MISALDWWVIIAYLLVIIAGGVYFTRRANRGLSEYFLTNRSLPWWIAGTSMVATSFSCDTPLYVTKLVRTGGIYLNWQWWSFLIGGMLSAFLLAKLWRRAEVLTDVELTELRYGGTGAKILRGFRALYFAIPINGIAMGWVLLAMAKIAAVAFGWPKWQSILIFSTAALSYSMLAGFWGVVVTDLVQFVLAIIGATAVAYFAVEAAGGMESIISYISSQPDISRDTLNFVPSFNIGAAGDWLTPAVIGFLTYNLVQWWANINSDGGGKVIQRINACKNENHALGAALWYNFAHFALRSWPWIIAALASIKLYPHLADPEMAYPKMIMELLPAGIKGLAIASLAAAFMSTIDTQLNWGASYLVNDFYKRFLNPGRSEKHYIGAAKAAVILLMFIAGLAAYFTESVTEAFKFIIAFGAGTGPVYIIRWFWWRINAWSEISAMLASSAISITLYSFTAMAFPVKVLIIAGGSAVVWISVIYLTPAVNIEILREFYRRVRPGGNWKPVRKETGLNPEPVKSALVNWMLGTAGLIGYVIAVGKFLVLETSSAVIAAIISFFCSMILYRRLRKNSFKTFHHE